RRRSTASSRRGVESARPSSRRPTAAFAVTRSCSPARCGTTCRTKVPGRSNRYWFRATTSALRATSTCRTTCPGGCGDRSRKSERMEPARTLHAVPTRSALAGVRVRRKLTVEEAAKRAGLSSDEAQWLEEGRVYRFPSTDDALAACVLYASALQSDRRA